MKFDAIPVMLLSNPIVLPSWQEWSESRYLTAVQPNMNWHLQMQMVIELKIINDYYYYAVTKEI